MSHAGKDTRGNRFADFVRDGPLQSLRSLFGTNEDRRSPGDPFEASPSLLAGVERDHQPELLRQRERINRGTGHSALSQNLRRDIITCRLPCRRRLDDHFHTDAPLKGPTSQKQRPHTKVYTRTRPIGPVPGDWEVWPRCTGSDGPAASMARAERLHFPCPCRY